MSVVTDFKSIRRKLDRMEQKAEFEAKNSPLPVWYSKPIVWTPDDGYSVSNQNKANG